MPEQTLARIEKRATLVTHIAIIGSIFGLLALLVIQVVVLLVITDQADRNGELSRQVVSCTTPGEDCYEDTVRRERELLARTEIDNLNATIAVLICFTEGRQTTENALRRCAVEAVRDQRLMNP